MPSRSVLILGAGIAGPALAYWLARHGYRPTVVEQARELRSGGSAVVVVKEPATTVAERMGTLGQLREVATSAGSPALLDASGRQVPHVPTTSERSVEVTRADLSAVLHQAAANEAEFVFDDTVTDIRQDTAGVDVTFRRCPPRRFDLLIGADGVHSTVRRLVFGPAERFTTDLGMYGATVPLEPSALDDPAVGREVHSAVCRGVRRARPNATAAWAPCPFVLAPPTRSTGLKSRFTFCRGRRSSPAPERT
jgi:2-polyprenyl-6-methoxyphenol hydroxylase-like FAD-dependent oxidoreductase